MSENSNVNSIRFTFVEKTKVSHTDKSLNISRAKTQVTSVPLQQALTILSNTTARGVAVQQVDLKRYWRSEK